jgi:CPA1 family monovalent cation:H+ antiporter
MNAEAVIILMFVVASVVAILARRFRVPYTVALVPVGLLLSGLHTPGAPQLTQELLFLIFLPGLLFAASYDIRFENLWRDRVAVLSLAIPGVVLSIALTAAMLVLAASQIDSLSGIGWGVALVIAATIAATDPVSVVSLFGELGAPRRLSLLIEGESLFNDGTTIVFFTLILSMVMGGSTSVSDLVLDFLREVGGGVLLGGVIGFVISQAVRHIDDAMVEVTLLSVAAYGSFLSAEKLGFSGVISTVVAGLVCGNYGVRTGMSPTTRTAVHTFWDYVGFALNSIVFLLIGFEIQLETLLNVWPIIVVAYVALMLARSVVIFGVSGLTRLHTAGIPHAWKTIQIWGGLRGAISMVLALSIPGDFPLRDVVVNSVFGVVLLSILLQGLSITWLIRRLGIVEDGTSASMRELELARARRALAVSALAEIEDWKANHFAPRDAIEAVEAEYRERAGKAEEALKQIEVGEALLHRRQTKEVRRRMLLFERTQLIESRRFSSMDDGTFNALLHDIDGRLLEIDTEEPTEDTS